MFSSYGAFRAAFSASALGMLLTIGTLGSSSVFAQTQKYQPNVYRALQPSRQIIIGYAQAALNQAPNGIRTVKTSRVLSKITLDRISGELSLSNVKLTSLKFTSAGHHVVDVGRTVSKAELAVIAAKLKANNPNIEFVEADRWVDLAQSATPNDHLYPSQWNLAWPFGVSYQSAINAFRTPRAQTDPLLPIVAIIDTGYRPHEDLDLPEMGRDYADNQPTPLDVGDARLSGECPNAGFPSVPVNSWHGVYVHGIINARTNNGLGIAGVNPEAKVYHARYASACSAWLSNYTSAIYDAANYVNSYGQRVRVINLSQASPVPCESSLQSVISYALSKNVVVVAAAGNSASIPAANMNPGNCTGVISVAASNRYGQLTTYASRGSRVDIAAPGGDDSTGAADNLISTWVNLPLGHLGNSVSTYYGHIGGSSFAAPHVSAVVSMMLTLNPLLSPSDVLKLLKSSITPFSDGCANCGPGILSAENAVYATYAVTPNAPGGPPPQQPDHGTYDVPTLPEWGMIALIASLVVVMLRRRAQSALPAA